MSTIPVFIPFVNRPDLLRLAIASVPRRLTAEPIVINNSGEPIDVQAKVIEPSVPLTASQSLNLMHKLAKQSRVPFYFFMHNDAEAGPETIGDLYELALRKCSRNKWGVIFTNYDALAAFNTEAFDAVGPWDTNLPQYFTDNDMYRRLRMAGYEMLESNLPVNHVGSQTLHADPSHLLIHRISFPIYEKYYTAKWGGGPGKETYRTPWGRE